VSGEKRKELGLASLRLVVKNELRDRVRVVTATTQSRAQVTPQAPAPPLNPSQGCFLILHSLLTVVLLMYCHIYTEFPTELAWLQS